MGNPSGRAYNETQEASEGENMRQRERAREIDRDCVFFLGLLVEVSATGTRPTSFLFDPLRHFRNAGG